MTDLIRFIVESACLAIAMASVVAATEPPAAKAAGDLTVMTYNIRNSNARDGRDAWSRRREEVAEFIARQDADVIGLQEALDGQVAFLKEKLADYDWYGVGRDDGKKAGEYAPLFYRRDRFEVLDKGTFWLSETPDEPGSKGWDAALPRVATWLRLKDKTTWNAVLAANVHYDHRGEKARVESGKLLRRRLAEHAASAPIVLLGDFNATAKSEPYRAIVEEAGEAAAGAALLDARLLVKEVRGPDTTWNGFKVGVPGQQIDHIFVGKEWQVIAVAVNDEKRKGGRFLSDHFPVVATLRLGAGK